MAYQGKVQTQRPPSGTVHAGAGSRLVRRTRDAHSRSGVRITRPKERMSRGARRSAERRAKHRRRVDHNTTLDPHTGFRARRRRFGGGPRATWAEHAAGINWRGRVPAKE